MRLPKNKLAMFHTHRLSEESIDYIIRHCDPIKIINRLEKMIDIYKSNNTKLHFPYMDKEEEILKELKKEIDIFDK